MKRFALPMLVAALFVWSGVNFVVFLQQAMTLDHLEKQEALTVRETEILKEYRDVKMEPDYPPELTRILSTYQSDRAAQFVRERAKRYDCLLVTRPVELEGFVLQEITEKLILTRQLSKNDPSRYHEVGHRLLLPFDQPGKFRRLTYVTSNGEGFCSVVDQRVRGFDHLPEEFVLTELRKMAAEIKAKGEAR